MSGRAVDGECLAVALVVVSLDQREFDLRIVELFDVVATRLGSNDLLDFDDLRKEAGQRCSTDGTKIFLTWIEWARARWREAMSL